MGARGWDEGQRQGWGPETGSMSRGVLAVEPWCLGQASVGLGIDALVPGYQGLCALGWAEGPGTMSDPSRRITMVGMG
eukprot:CAMPEP_0119106022 /NCGR_PEP_ID=MMETSP1180-20130426/3832_1 /TAXON_ID=3052 ORGANISM="Chlamydomonas cf sp, Strain CCMP681" /NCGR_SAMPLE_ID=MMETSP1180 /ASSEMBLY_ACC=CAM_ASM_000741 /LENGTH=77 /DNA_ID=CAMNT_0007091239 /DNA_START=333 /DNA_END=562 /DNA_ORIENTATION=-